MTGLYNLQARLYDPNTGRFMQQDPRFGDLSDPLSLNPYTYVENNPTTATDPAGLCDTGVQGDPGCNGAGPSSAGSPMVGPLAEEPGPAPDTDPGQASVGNQAINQVSQASYRLFGDLLDGLYRLFAGESGADAFSPAVAGGATGYTLPPGAEQIVGGFPRTAAPDQTLYRTDPSTGALTAYQEYDSSGLPLKRVDLVGRPHGGIPTPHIQEFNRNIAPDGTIYVNPGVVRPALPQEIP